MDASFKHTAHLRELAALPTATARWARASLDDGRMEEEDVIKHLGPPHEIKGREDRMRSRAWMCSTCRQVVGSDAPITVPAPCGRCGGIAFEVVEVKGQ